MLLEVYLLDISRSPHVYRRDILLHLCVIALLVALVVHEHAAYLHYSPYEDCHAYHTDDQLAYALAFELLGGNFMG